MHERLYRDAEAKIVDLSAYLTEVCDDLKGVISPRVIDFKTSEQIRMGTDRAVLVALLVGELVINAAKHAYPEGPPGQIRVRLTRADDEIRGAVSGTYLQPNNSDQTKNGNNWA